jgi:hypothetical protein
MSYTLKQELNFLDFQGAEPQQEFDLIPKGTVAKVNMTIKPGGYNDPERGWTGGYATASSTTDSVYLNCEFVILEGPFAKRKVWSLIGLHSPKGPTWGNSGRSFIRAILNSSRGFAEKDNSPQAIAARQIKAIEELNGIEFLAKIAVEKNQDGEERNLIKIALTKDHKDYDKSGQPVSVPTASSASESTKASTAPAWAR